MEGDRGGIIAFGAIQRGPSLYHISSSWPPKMSIRVLPDFRVLFVVNIYIIHIGSGNVQFLPGISCSRVGSGGWRTVNS